MARAVAWLVTGGLAASLAGCFNSAGPSSSSDGGGSLTCNDLVPLSDSLVEATSSGSADLPVATGGEIQAGLYHLVSSVYYPAPSCGVSVVSTRLRVIPSASATPAAAGSLEIAIVTAAGDTLRESVSYIVSGTSLTVRIGCIDPNPGLAGSSARIPFNASASELQLFQSTPGCGTSVDTYQLDGV